MSGLYHLNYKLDTKSTVLLYFRFRLPSLDFVRVWTGEFWLNIVITILQK